MQLVTATTETVELQIPYTGISSSKDVLGGEVRRNFSCSVHIRNLDWSIIKFSNWPISKTSLHKDVGTHKMRRKEYGEDLVVDGTELFGASCVLLT